MRIYIFRDYGVSVACAENIKFSLSMSLQDWSFHIRYVSAEDIRNGVLNVDKTSLFVMGGGRFTEVRKTLGPEGLQAIKNYIRDGGGYCGICMGAYAAFEDIEFHGKEKRIGKGLAIFNQLIAGHLNIIPSFDGSVNSATVIDVYHMDTNIKSPSLYWGGFDMPEEKMAELDATPLSSFTTPDGRQKILSFKQDRKDQGNPIFLSATHFEACTRKMIWDTLKHQNGSIESLRRIQQELILYPANSFYMGLAAALDHMELVKDFSFRQRIWPDLPGHGEKPKMPSHREYPLAIPAPGK